MRAKRDSHRGIYFEGARKRGQKLMFAALRIGLKIAGPTIAAITATVVITSSASAISPASRGRTRQPLSLQTLFGGVRVFASPKMAASITARLGGEGTGVSVKCWTDGAYFRDSRIWYEVTAPDYGYVPAFNFLAHFAPAKGLSHCAWPAFSEPFNSLAPNLRIRSAPSTTAGIVGYLVSVGSIGDVACYRSGTPVFGDAIWYRVTTPAVGYITGRFLNTGGDPAPGVPPC
jgi:hypothetical protein